MSTQDEHPTLQPIPRSTAEQVWRRAIELQDERGEIVSPETLLHVAKELDVDPAYVELAMEEVRRAEEADEARRRAVTEAAASRQLAAREADDAPQLPRADWWRDEEEPAARGSVVHSSLFRLSFGAFCVLTLGRLVVSQLPPAEQSDTPFAWMADALTAGPVPRVLAVVFAVIAAIALAQSRRE